MSAPGWLPAALPMPGSVRAGTTQRAGGVSQRALAAFNLGAYVNDDPCALAENRRRLRQALDLPSEPLWLKQVHGTAVFEDDGTEPTQPYDAAVTSRPGRVLAVTTADCLPVVFVCDDGERLGIAHAGWRGLAAGVLEATLTALKRPSARLQAWLGPCIGPVGFEVGEEVRAAFADACRADADAFVRNGRGRWQCDLVTLAVARLRRAGVQRVAVSGACTWTDADHYYSYRRDPGSGRMATLVWRGESHGC